MTKPNLFVVGEAKSGTTALANFLEQHPDVFMSTEKEPSHFRTDINQEVYDFQEERGQKRVLEKAWRYKYEKLDDYLALFEDTQAPIAGEASIYIESRVAAELIHEFNPDAKIVVLYREPISYLQSLYYHAIRNSNENATSFEQALAWEDDRRNGRRLPDTLSRPSSLYYSEKIKYAQKLRRFLRVFPASQIKVVLFEEFRKDNGAATKEVFEFLGVDPMVDISTRQLNVGSVPRFQKLQRVMRSTGLSQIVKRKSRGLHRILTNVYKTLVFRKVDKPELDPAFEQSLRSTYKSEVVELNELLNAKGLIDKDLVEFWGYDRA